MKTRTNIIAAALSLLTPALALAQGRPWLADRSYSEGMGIRTGDLELHPSVAGEVGYDSNYFQRSTDKGQEYTWDRYGVSSSLRFRLTPSLTLSTLSPQRKVGDTGGVAAPPKFNFSAGAFASYNELIGLSGSDDYGRQRHIDGGANLLFDILPQRPIGVDLQADFVRTVSPLNDPSISNAWNRDSLHGGVGLTWRPGGGLFEWRVGYDLLYNYFESQAFSGYGNIRNTVGTRGRWKFYPRTALIYDAQTYWISYTNSGAPRNDGQIIQSRLGLNGLVTNQFALLALVGWATTHFEPTATASVPENLNTLVGQAELKWFILPQPRLQPGDATVGLSSLTLGYLRDFSQSYLADYFRRDRVYVGGSYFVGGRYLVDLQGGYSRIAHPTFVRAGALDTQPKHVPAENRVDVQLFTEYRTSDSFGINVTLRYDASLTRAEYPVTNPPGSLQPNSIDNLAFSRFTGWLGVRWFM